MAPETEAGDILVERRGDVAVLHLLGEHDTFNVERLRQAIAAPALAGDGVVVSLMETQVIDSSVIHALFCGDQGLSTNGRRLTLHVATEAIVRRVLEITGVTTDLPSTGSLEEALAFAARDATA
jgi:anti-anti-sigma factor